MNSLLLTLWKSKVFPYFLPSIGFGADPKVQAVSPLVTYSESRHRHGSRLALLSARPAVTFIAFTIYWSQKDERLSWPGWLTCSGWFSHNSGHLSTAGQAKDTERDRRSTTVRPISYHTCLIALFYDYSTFSMQSLSDKSGIDKTVNNFKLKPIGLQHSVIPHVPRFHFYYTASFFSRLFYITH